VSTAARLAASRPAETPGIDTADRPDTANVSGTARRLAQTVSLITPGEFHWQDSHYAHDSYYGRELLFLVANDEWTRSTRETVDVTTSDSVDTQIEIEVDLDQITHEVFRTRHRVIWLPLLVLPGPALESSVPDGKGNDAENAKPDPFATLKVTDAAGRLLTLLPNADVMHRISAALAEIVVNIAVARWPRADAGQPVSTRDQRLLLSAAMYRLLRWGSGGSSTGPVDRAPDWPGQRESGRVAEQSKALGRIASAKQQLQSLLAQYIADYEHGQQEDRANAAEVTDQVPAHASDGSESQVPDPSSAMLTRRAVQVLNAFADAIVVVIPFESTPTPTTFSVRAPTRHLKEADNKPRIRRPRTRLWIDLLLPSADADRQIQVNLPDGVSFDKTASAPPGGDVVIAARRPQPLQQMCSLMGELLRPEHLAPANGSVRRCIADLAVAKADAAIEAFRYHVIRTAEDTKATRTAATRSRLAQVRAKLEELSADDAGSLDELGELWGNGDWIPEQLYRPTIADTLSPRAAIVRATAIEDVYQRGTPTCARIELNVAVTDAQFFSAARFTGFMSILIMAVVLIFFAVAATRGYSRYSTSPNAEVLAAALTLFSVIQAGRIRYPDRSSLHGLLSSTGNSLIVLSVLPATVLAIAIAFHITRWTPVFWAAGAIVAELLLVLLMLRGPLSDTGEHPRPPRRLLYTWPSPAYDQSEVLRSDWWRSTTAEALMIGTPAHAFVVWQHSDSPALSQLLDARVTPSGVRSAVRSADVLALLRSGTTNAALTFILFREQPSPEWAKKLDARPVPTDSQRLAPLETCTDLIDVLVGLAPDKWAPLLRNHPIKLVLGVAAEHQLIVLDAQNPVPTPSSRHAAWRWSRVRVGLRGADVYRVGEFLFAIRDLATANPSWDLRVQMTPACPARPVNRVRYQPHERAPGRLVLDSDLDAVTKATGRTHEHDRSRWRFMAICADARVGIENELIEKLAAVEPNLRLAGVNSAILHGMAVILLLARQNSHHDFLGKQEVFQRLGDMKANVSIPLDAWMTCDELGHAGHYPLLRIRLRNQNRPGIMGSLLGYLGTRLRAEFEFANPGIEINTWHAQSEITAGYAAFTRISAPLPIRNGTAGESPDEVARKLRARLENTEREVRNWAGEALAADVDRFTEDTRFTDEPVISINFIEIPPD
jgi:hypothetical protein